MVFKSFLSKSKDIDILALLPDGVMLVDNSGSIEWMSEVLPVLFNIPKTQLSKMNLNEIIESGMDLARQAAESSKSVVGRAKNKAEKDFYAEITARYAEGYLVIAFRDVTQSYKTVTSILVEHESSKKINKDKNTFLVKLSNELKSPIHSVVGFSQAMIDGLGGEMSDKQEKYVKIINKNSNEVLYLLDKILELSKTESNLIEYDFQIFDIVNSIQLVLKDYEQIIKEKNLNLSFNADEIVKRKIFSDENAFKMILQNIIECSVNATDIGSISINLSYPDADIISMAGIDVTANATDKSYIMIKVSDTGAGIADNDLNVIFEPYAQLDRPNKKNIVRSIALASVKNIVKYLKGSIWVESEPMQGTNYIFILPVERL